MFQVARVGKRVPQYVRIVFFFISRPLARVMEAGKANGPVDNPVGLNIVTHIFALSTLVDLIPCPGPGSMQQRPAGTDSRHPVRHLQYRQIRAKSQQSVNFGTLIQLANLTANLTAARHLPTGACAKVKSNKRAQFAQIVHSIVLKHNAHQLKNANWAARLGGPNSHTPGRHLLSARASVHTNYADELVAGRFAKVRWCPNESNTSFGQTGCTSSRQIRNGSRQVCVCVCVCA